MHAAGIELDVDLALDAAGDGGRADVAHRLQALDDDLVGEVVRSRTERMSERTAIDTIGWSSGLKRWISGSLTSGRKAARTCWTFSRTSCMATADGTESSNSAMTIDWPSSEREDSVLRPAMALTALLDLAADLALDRLRRGAGIVGA